MQGEGPGVRVETCGDASIPNNHAGDLTVKNESKQVEEDTSEKTEDEAGLLALFAPVYAVVRAIPAGKVMTYGQVADATTGVSVTARQVGAALRWVPADVPWQRVVGAGGHLPIAKRSPEAQQRQRQLLADEGIVFLARDPNRVDMPLSQWFPVKNVDDTLISDKDSKPGETGNLFDGDSPVPPSK